MRRPPTSTLARASRGQINWVTLLLVLLLAGGSYLGWVWVPLYIVNFEVKQVVRDYLNQSIKNKNDDVLKQKLVHKLRTVHQVEVTTPEGKVKKVPAIDLKPGDITWERDAASQPPTVRIAFQYTRAVVYPYLDREDEQVFEIDLMQDVSPVDWGPSR